MRCPLCEKQFEPEQSKALPFCSPRCRQVDLGRWLGESYHVPSVRNDDEEEFESEAAPREPDE